MMTDKPDGQTHFYLDGCPDKSHNPKYLTVRFVFDRYGTPEDQPNPGTPGHLHEILQQFLKPKGLNLDDENNIHI